LMQLGQILGEYRDALVVGGGPVPSLALPTADPPHIGTLDIDLDLDPNRLKGGGYAALIDILERAGYQRNLEALKPFQLQRLIDLRDGAAPVSVLL
jgi:hypothetical protein